MELASYEIHLKRLMKVMRARPIIQAPAPVTLSLPLLFPVLQALTWPSTRRLSATRAVPSSRVYRLSVASAIRIAVVWIGDVEYKFLYSLRRRPQKPLSPYSILFSA